MIGFDSQAIQVYTMNFAKFFSMFNVLGTIPIFLGLTASLPPQLVRRAAFLIALTGLVGTYVFAFAGTSILRFFDISLESFRVAGGIIIAIAGYKMLTSPVEDDADAAQVKPIKSHKESMMYAITPIGMPLVFGPGCISLVISAAGETTDAMGNIIWDQRIALLLALASVAFCLYIVLVGGRLIKHVLGQQGTVIILKIMGLILMVMAVQMFMRGLADTVTTLYGIQTIAPELIDLNA